MRLTTRTRAPRCARAFVRHTKGAPSTSVATETSSAGVPPTASPSAPSCHTLSSRHRGGARASVSVPSPTLVRGVCALGSCPISPERIASMPSTGRGSSPMSIALSWEGVTAAPRLGAAAVAGVVTAPTRPPPMPLLRRRSDILLSVRSAAAAGSTDGGDASPNASTCLFAPCVLNKTSRRFR